MNSDEKNNEENSEEPFDLSFLEESLKDIPDSPAEEVMNAGSFGSTKFGAIEIDPSLPLEEQVEAAAEAARNAGLPDDVVERIKEAILHKIGAATGLVNTALNFASSAAFATMLAGSEEYSQALALIGHEYHKKINDTFGDSEWIQIPICVCQLTNQPNLNHQHSTITPPNAPADYDEQRKEFIRLTKQFQRDCAALSTLVFGIGIGGVQFDNER
jgi:hypothetical protein|tara:strand:+ start:2545 stop:3189 length:645 start_codon:yes stop_codon:yes gene_type:complete